MLRNIDEVREGLEYAFKQVGLKVDVSFPYKSERSIDIMGELGDLYIEWQDIKGTLPLGLEIEQRHYTLFSWVDDSENYVMVQGNPPKSWLDWSEQESYVNQPLGTYTRPSELIQSTITQYVSLGIAEALEAL